MTAEPTKETLGRALGSIPSGLFIITAGRLGDNAVGMLASWVMQIEFEPPTLIFSVGKDRPLLEQLERSGVGVINVLPKGANDLMRPFMKYSPNAFDDLDVKEVGNGIVLNKALAYMSVHLINVLSGPKHAMVMAEVDEGMLLDEEAKPWVHIRKSGFDY